MCAFEKSKIKQINNKTLCFRGVFGIHSFVYGGVLTLTGSTISMSLSRVGIQLGAR